MTTSLDTSNMDNMLVVLCDLNGSLRGKRIPKSQFEKAINGGMRLPLSICGVDIWGEDIVLDSNVFQDGDKDGIAEFTGRGPLPILWEAKETALIPVSLLEDDGNAFAGDPRRVLANVVDKFKAKGLTPIVATELEFYLYDKSEIKPKPPVSPVSNLRLSSDDILSINELEAFDNFFNDVYNACHEFGIPADTAISESGRGQFEINLLHVDCPLKAADDAVYFKYIVKSLAYKHNLGASFMAKPYSDMSGNGFHVHFSLLDEAGNNVFDDGSDEGSLLMKYAVNGLIESMADSMLVFAPHLNSYRRLQPGAHAPTTAAWGYENRTSAIRIPGGENKARRIEHRVSGADANPYLVLAAILTGALHGIESEKLPPEPIEGDSYENTQNPLPTNWTDTIAQFENSDLIKAQFDETFINMFLRCKKQEQHVFANKISTFEYQTYLGVV